MPALQRRSASGAAALAIVGAVSVAFGQPSSDERAFAEGLFREGRQLLNRRDFEAACPKFAESYRLDPALGTLLNLAVCHERQGRVASAWAEYNDAAVEAQRAGDKGRAAYARGRAQRLEPKLAFVVVRVAAPAEALDVKLGDTSVGQAAWGTPLPVDPGEHALRARAPGYKPFTTTVPVGAGSRAVVEVPPLDPEPPPAVAPSRDTRARPASGPAGELNRPTAKRTPAPPASPWRGVGYGLVGAGVVGLGVSSYFGLRAISFKGRRDDACERGRPCDAAGVAYDRDARRAAAASTVSFVAGAALAAAGATLLVIAPSRPGRAVARLGLRPAWGGLSVEGAF